ncbi:MAG: crossover junction endodeoxyribonuclease RuvC [Candidatus Paceibacterota bacterium]
MRVLAVDPGYDRLGIAVMEHADGKEQLVYSTCIETNRSMPLPDRLKDIGETFNQLLSVHTPDSVAVETIFFNKNQKTAVMVAEARGVILYLAKQFGCTVYEFGPQEIKVAVTGYGNSDKTAVFDMLSRLISNLPNNALDDEYDAVAIGITCLAHHR